MTPICFIYLSIFEPYLFLYIFLGLTTETIKVSILRPIQVSEMRPICLALEDKECNSFSSCFLLRLSLSQASQRVEVSSIASG